MVAYSVLTLFRRWLDNTDASSIYFKHYNENEEDKYPTYSLCFHSTGNGALFDYFEMELFENFMLGPEELEMILEGKEINYTRRYLNFQNISNIKYEQYMLKLDDIVRNLEFSTDSDSYLYSYENFDGHGNVTGNDKEWPFYVSHTDPRTICFTQKSKYVQNLTRKNDVILLSLTRLKEWNKFMYLKLFAHHPGQLTRVLDTPIFNTMVDVINRQNNHMVFSISQVSILRKRADANVPCDQYLQDDESKLRQQIIKKNGCHPIYWEPLMELPNLSGRCNNSSQLRSVYHDIKDYKKVLKSYKAPCNEMRGVTTLQSQPYGYSDGYMFLDILYMEETYQEIVNHRDFTLQGFFSDCGGFVGMILGYSLLQVPHEIGKIWQMLRIRRN